MRDQKLMHQESGHTQPTKVESTMIFVIRLPDTNSSTSHTTLNYNYNNISDVIICSGCYTNE